MYFFSFFISSNFIFFTNECPGLCRHKPGHSLVKKIKLNEIKNEKKLHGFSYYKNIANFEAFWRDKNFSKNILFLGSEQQRRLHPFFKKLCSNF